jgi:hypothetical protein
MMHVLRQFSGKGFWKRVFRCTAYMLLLAMCLPAPGAFVFAASTAPAKSQEKDQSAAPRTMTSVLLEQAASFIGVPAPVQPDRPDMDEGLGFHQDGTARKAGGVAGDTGPSDNGRRAAAYMRSGMSWGINGRDALIPGQDPLTGEFFRYNESVFGEKRKNSGMSRSMDNFDPLRMGRDRVMSWGIGFLNSSAESLLSGLVDNGRARLNFTIDADGHFQGEGDVLLPFYDGQYTTIYTQLGARSMAVSGGLADGQDRWIGNFGLGQRWFPDATEEDSGNWMIGYNVFFDNDFTRSHQRGGVGVEVQFDWLRLASNFYYPLSDWKGSYDFDSRFIEERPAQGWDARVKAYLPFYRNVALTGSFTQWYGDHVGMFGHNNLEKDPRVWSYGIEFTPVPMISAFVNQRSTERGKTDTEFGLNFTYHFGIPLEDQLKHSKVAELRTVSGSRHEFVDRENKIILEYRAKNAYRIEYLGMVGANIFRFRIVNGFDEFMAGQTVHVTASGPYLAEAASAQPASLLARAARFLDDLLSVRAAYAADRAKSYVTDSKGEFLVKLDDQSLPPGGTVTVTVRAGNNQQTFTLNGNSTPLNELVVTFNKTHGEDFVSGGSQGYQSVVTMTVKKYVNGAEVSWTPVGHVTWTVTSAVSGLTTGSEGVWKRDAGAKNGLMWVSSASDSVNGTTDWSADVIRGTAPTTATAYLADVVGSRTITVKVADDSDSSSGQDTFTFGKGPLSVFNKVGTSGVQWSPGYLNGATDSTYFQYPSQTFPAAAFCGGTVNNNVTVNGTYTDSNAGFDISSGGGWSSGHQVTGSGSGYVRYAETSKLANTDQLLAVAVFNSSYNNTGLAAGRKGAARAAGWPVNSNWFWTGEVRSDGLSFGARDVNLDNGNTNWHYVHSSVVIPVCVP